MTIKLPKGMPSAAYTKWCLCSDPKCGPHLVLFDENDKPIAQAVYSNMQATQMGQELMEMLVYGPARGETIQ